MVRYYGFLANRKRGILLPKVYEALGMIVKAKVTFSLLTNLFSLLKKYCVQWAGRHERGYD